MFHLHIDLQRKAWRGPARSRRRHPTKQPMYLPDAGSQSSNQCCNLLVSESVTATIVKKVSVYREIKITATKTHFESVTSATTNLKVSWSPSVRFHRPNFRQLLRKCQSNRSRTSPWSGVQCEHHRSNQGRVAKNFCHPAIWWKQSRHFHKNEASSIVFIRRYQPLRSSDRKLRASC